MDQLISSPKLLGNAIKQQRKAKKLNQKEAGRTFKIEQSTISNIERGVSGTRIGTLFRLLAALDLEMVIRPKKTNSDNTTTDW